VIAAWAAYTLNVKIRLIGRENLSHAGNALLVGNHLSYLDIVIIASQATTCFVTSMEIRETPFLGQICMLAGCLFVERRSRKDLAKEIEELTVGLSRGLCVTIFPEATSTNGEQILRFRRPLFLAAVKAQKPVIPMVINYRVLGKDPLSVNNRDKVFWYGDMPFASHLWELCGLGNIEVDLNFLEPIYPSPDQEPGELSAKAQVAVESVFIPVRPFEAEKALKNKHT
jgi:1-acyl-sn-glycerol-3-phosphate acyltransferase